MTGGEAGPAHIPEKTDPRKLELRGQPRPAVGIRKGLVVGLAGGLAALIALVSFAALGPTSLALDPPPLDLNARAKPSDALEGAPGSYDQVPILGPPLPGDLGRPILKHQMRLGERRRPAPAVASPDGEEKRRVEIRTSPLLVSLKAASRADPDASRKAGKGETAPAGHILSAATIISASLITGLNSDVPGLVVAQVTEPVRDSATGEQILIPQGARLIGDYDSKVSYGQRRAMLSWTRIVLPNGCSLALDKLPAADQSGYSGLADEVDFHGWRLAKGVALSTIFGIGTELGLGEGDDRLVRALANSAQLGASRAGDEIIRRNLDVKPTITIRPGWPVRLILHEDLALPPCKG